LGQPTITVDNLEVAQFIYLLLHNEKIRRIIDTIATKVVLILGRFTAERKVILDGIRDALRSRDYVPVLFDFHKPMSRDSVETISTLAHMAKFVVADLTEAKSVLQELQRIVPSLPSLPVKPLLHVSEYEPGMIDHFRKYRSFLEPYQYEDLDGLLEALEEEIIAPAEQMRRELTGDHL